MAVWLMRAGSHGEYEHKQDSTDFQIRAESVEENAILAAGDPQVSVWVRWLQTKSSVSSSPIVLDSWRVRPSSYP